VTGITVNKRTNVSKAYVRNLRAALHNWETTSYKEASVKHEQYYVNEKGFLRYDGQIPRMELVLGGKLEFLGMVRGKGDTTYRLLKLRFDQLCKKQEVDTGFLKEILDLWEDKGLKKAIDRFYNRQKNLIIE
jgi:RNA-directed DNA polymerase